MRIIDEITEQEITNPDLTIGFLRYNPGWAPKSVYERAEAEGLPNVPDEWFEEVQLYRVYTAEEIAQREEAEREAEHQEIINALPDAVAELSVMVSDNAIDTTDLQDALAELSEIVSGLME